MKDLGVAHYVLGIEITRDRLQKSLGLSQKNYIDRVLKRFNMENCNGGDVPIAKGDKFSLAQCPVTIHDIEQMKEKPYALLVGSVIDANLGGCVDDKMSTSCYVFTLAGGAISWRSKKQTTRAVLTMESEYIGCFEAMRQAGWLKNLIHYMGVLHSIEKPIKIYCDNTSAVFFAKNNKRSEASRLMDIKYLKLQDKIREGVVDIEHLGTFHMVADPLTKALHVTAFRRHLPNMGLQSSMENI
ncbi:hypothetical protein ACFX13_031577 [Malus domestica]